MLQGQIPPFYLATKESLILMLFPLAFQLSWFPSVFRQFSSRKCDHRDLFWQQATTADCSLKRLHENLK